MFAATRRWPAGLGQPSTPMQLQEGAGSCIPSQTAFIDFWGSSPLHRCSQQCASTRFSVHTAAPGPQGRARAAAEMAPLKAVFFGRLRRRANLQWCRCSGAAAATAATVVRHTAQHTMAACRSLTPPFLQPPQRSADLDDTLVLTEDCDRAAFARVAELAEELLPGVWWDEGALLTGIGERG